MNIRPVSDLRNKYNEVEQELRESGAVYLTRNGYGTAVLMDIKEYTSLTGKDIPKYDTRPKSPTSDRGFLHQYANPELWELEKDAWAMHCVEKYGKGVSRDE